MLRKGTVSRTAATSRVSKDLCVYGHSLFRGAGNFPDLFTPPLQVCRIFSISAPCMESMFKMLSQHTVYPQAVPWIFLFLLSTQPWLCLLCFQGFGTAAGCSSSTFCCPLSLSYFISSASMSPVTPDCCHMYCSGSIPSH